MLLLRFLFKLVNVMNSETSARSLAAAVGLGFFLGLVPLLSLQGGVVLAIVLFLRVNLSLALASTLFGKLLLGPLLENTFHELGVSLLEREDLYDTWSSLANHSLLSYALLNNSVALGSTVVALAALVPVWFVGSLLVGFYRSRIEQRLMQSKVVTTFKSLKIYNLYRTVTSPFN